MKKFVFSSILLCALFSAGSGHAQVSANNDRNNFISRVFTVDTTTNHVDFGEKKNKRAFVTTFEFRQVNTSLPNFTFSKAQIQSTNMTRGSGVTKIELTNNGFELTYDPKDKLGAVDDLVVVHTANGDLSLRLTGTIVEAKKKAEAATQ